VSIKIHSVQQAESLAHVLERFVDTRNIRHDRIKIAQNAHGTIVASHSRRGVEVDRYGDEREFKCSTSK
jgi:hypothetical protein